MVKGLNLKFEMFLKLLNILQMDVQCEKQVPGGDLIAWDFLIYDDLLLS